MKSISNGNLYFNVILNEETKNNNGLTLRFSPLDALLIQNQRNTKRLLFRVSSCGTFEMSLQPMVCVQIN